MQVNRPSILIIVQNLPVPFDRRVWQEATSLQRGGFEVAVVCPKKKMYTASYEQLEGVDIYRYPLVYEADKGVFGYFVEFVYCWLATLWLALKAYAHRPFQVIHACNPPDTYFALALLFRTLGVRFVFDYHDLCPEMFVAKGHRPSGLLYRCLLTLEWLTLRTSNLVIAVNESHKSIAVKRGGIRESKVRVVRSGPRRAWADIANFDPGVKRGHRYMVMYLGEMCEQDGVEHLLRAAQHYRETAGDDTLFVFVGGGPDQPRMKRMADDMHIGPVVYFTGRIPDQDLWVYLSTADVCVDPDPLTEWSNLSTMNKIIEYMSFGCPIIAFDLLEHRRSAGPAALYVEPNNDIALSIEIRRLLLDEQRRAEMSQTGRARFRDFLAWENSEVQLLASYRALIGGPQAGAETLEETKPLPLAAAGHKTYCRESLSKASSTRSTSSQEFFDQHAASWEKYYVSGGAMLNRTLRFRDALDHRFPQKGRILDFGCGSGDLSNFLASAGYEVVGVDQASHMIARAAERFSSKSLKFRWLGAPSQPFSLPFADGEFDAVICSSVLEYVDDLKAHLAEFARVCKHRGWLMATIPNMLHPLRYFEKIERVARSMFRDPSDAVGSRLDYLNLSKNRFPLRSWLRLLSDAGWRTSHVTGQSTSLALIAAQRA